MRDERGIHLGGWFLLGEEQGDREPSTRTGRAAALLRHTANTRSHHTHTRTPILAVPQVGREAGQLDPLHDPRDHRVISGLAIPGHISRRRLPAAPRRESDATRAPDNRVIPPAAPPTRHMTGRRDARPGHARRRAETGLALLRRQLSASQACLVEFRETEQEKTPNADAAARLDTMDPHTAPSMTRNYQR